MTARLPMRSLSKWTPEADARLTTLWLVPENTVVGIGAVFGVSDNAVSGRARRIGLKPKGYSRIGPSKAAVPVQVKVAMPAHVEPPRQPSMSLTDAIAIAMRRSPKACQFPTSRHKPFLFCDAMAREGFVYCQHHAEISYIAFVARRGDGTQESESA